MTYLDLKQALEDWSKRTDAANHMDTFISLTEIELWDKLRLRSMEATQSSTLDTADRYHPLPDDFLEMRRLRLLYADGGYYDLKYKDPNNLSREIWWYSSPWTGNPTEFTVESQIEFNRVPDQPYDIEILYWKSLPGLSATNLTNEVLDDYENLYLFGGLKYLYLWAKNYEEAGVNEALFEELIGRANRTARRGRYGPAPAIAIPGMVI